MLHFNYKNYGLYVMSMYVVWNGFVDRVNLWYDHFILVQMFNIIGLKLVYNNLIFYDKIFENIQTLTKHLLNLDLFVNFAHQVILNIYYDNLIYIWNCHIIKNQSISNFNIILFFNIYQLNIHQFLYYVQYHNNHPFIIPHIFYLIQ